MSTAIYLQVEPAQVNYLNRIMEGYEYLGTVSTLDRKAGVVLIRTTPDTAEEVRRIIAHLPIPFSYLKKEAELAE